MSEEIAKEVLTVDIEDELKKSYLDYAMSVIVSRALPDVRDGLKPVHRRVLYAMHELGNDWNKPYKKSARIVGDVIGKYHPHGDMAVYETIVRMAQPFSMRYLLVDGQGNFGSIDGDSPAAMRYTEIRMSRLSHSLLSDLEKETVDFELNYDETETMPAVLPTRVPNLLINGSSGIAVGMATNIPPHNLNEVVDACIALIDNPELTIDGLLHYIKGPDFPTAGTINGRAGIIEAYRTGRGRISIRAKTHLEESESGRKESIIVTELPYQINKAYLLEKIAELIKEKKIEGISALRDESDKDGMRVVIELRRGENAEVLLNNLYAHTQLQNIFGINMVALDHGQPKLMNLKEILEAFLDHRREVVTRRTAYELRKARERAHVLEGLGIALANIDEMIALIKAAKTPAEAKEKLLAKVWSLGQVLAMLERTGAEGCKPENIGPQYGLHKKGYYLSPEQVQAILDLKLHRLTGLEQDKIFNEYEQLLSLIKELYEILLSTAKLMQIIRQELLDTKKQFGDERKTEIIEARQEFTAEDLITEEDMVVTLSHEGYIKSQPLSSYQAQHRGGKGKIATSVKEEDFIDDLLVASTHDTILCFSDLGKAYWLKVYQISQATRQSRGRPIVNLLSLSSEERINALLPVKTFACCQCIVMATAKGMIKKVDLEQFAHPRSKGIIAIGLDKDDYLVGVNLTDCGREIMLFTSAGKAIRFSETEVRSMGRTAKGVRGVKLGKNQKVIAQIVVDKDVSILTATENGYGKRTIIDEYRTTRRGGQGIISIRVTKRNGNAVGAIQVKDDDEVMLITNQGTLVRIKASEIGMVGRNTQGVRLISLSNSEKLIALERIME
jgi:DNA gyrase subunit A